MTHILPPLPYATNALAPKMSQETLEYHHDKHHQTYINNLNALIPGTPFADLSLEEIILKADGAIFNNAAQAWNHTFFFESLSPTPKLAPTGKLLSAIERDFGSMEQFQEAFTKAAIGLFGSGWAWLVSDKKGALHIVAASNAGNPLTAGMTPLLTCDVWEHAYYIDSRNRRPEYLVNFWGVADWGKVEERYAERP